MDTSKSLNFSNSDKEKKEENFFRSQHKRLLPGDGK